MLVADSGGTKTDWRLLGERPRSLQTRGLNPNLAGPETLREVLCDEVLPWLEGSRPESVFFFGAGLAADHHRRRTHDLLAAHFPHAETLRVDTDLMAAAHACLGDRAGTAGIVGTGSVAFHFDGTRITARKGGHGYLLGDEGGGPSIGRAFLRIMADGVLPAEITAAYRAFSGLDPGAVAAELYSFPDPHHFLAAQVPFLAEYRDRAEIRAILAEPLEIFVSRDLAPLCEPGEPVVLMGGIADNFSEIITSIGAEHGTPISILEARPIDALTEYLMTTTEETAHALRDRL